MNDLLTFEQFVLDHLDDRLAARALIDFREELLGTPHRAAVRAVASIRRQRKNADEIGRASRLITLRSWVRVPLFEEMLGACGEDSDSCSAAALIVAGSRPPYIQATGHPDADEPPHHTIVVGARWLLRAAERHGELRSPSEREIRDALRFGKEL